MHKSSIDAIPRFTIGDSVKIQTLSNKTVDQTTVIEAFFREGGERVTSTLFGTIGATRGWHYVCSHDPDVSIHEAYLFPTDPPEDHWLTEFKAKSQPKQVAPA